MGLKRYLGFEKRAVPRYETGINVEFHIWDALRKKPMTSKVPGKLVNISSKGACLQTKKTLIDGHHLLRDDGLEGDTPLILNLPPSSASGPWTIQARVLWYNRNEESQGQYPFNVGLTFTALSPAERKQLEELVKAAAAGPR
jgi:hypothetical protein